MQGLRDARGQRCIVIVADPALEQIAEDVERIRATRLAGEELGEQFNDMWTRFVQMQVGDEQGWHLRRNSGEYAGQSGRFPAQRRDVIQFFGQC